MKLYNFTVYVKDESVIQKQTKQVYNNIYEYSFPANGTYLFMSEKPEFTKETPGKVATKAHWIPSSKIIKIEMESSTKFESLMDRKKYIDALG